ncbi:hypothetical protein R3Q06_32005 [Rhodococcus erythropolis]|nr:hypothetical protein [Rhodococcus erythropolis]MDV6278103.1 hypothetical protein [Rhodococcus erythropolis]
MNAADVIAGIGAALILGTVAADVVAERVRAPLGVLVDPAPSGYPHSYRV